MKTALLVIVILMLACSAWAVETTVWQIGQFDNNYEEFAIPHNGAAYPGKFPQDVTFRVGTDAPKAWPFIHPGPVDAWAESRIHPFMIVFNLPDQPKGIFTLIIDLIDTHGAMPPTYDIRINDQGGFINLPLGAGDASITNASSGKEYIITLPLTASYFRQGENKLELKSASGSWVLYDALKLVNDADASTLEPTINNLTITPTMRLVRKGSKLKQVIQISADLSPGAPNTTVIVEANGKKSEALLKPSFLGAALCEAYVDETSKPTTVQATVTLGGQTKTATCELRPQRHWKVYVMPTSHVDIGYTDFQENVKVRQNLNTSLAIDLCNKFPDFKWNTEVGWAQDIYLSMMPADRKAEFIKLAQEGRMGCQVIYGNMLTGICSHEELIRNLYYTHSTAKQYGIPFDMAVSTDVPTHVWTLPSVLAGSGIRYFAAGLNTVRADSATRLFNKPFYWQGPDGASVLTWLFPGYAGAGSLGLTENMVKARTQVDGFLGSFNRQDYPYDAVFSHGAFADNVPLDPHLASVVDEWNRTYAYPQIILCRGPEFFSYIEKKFKDKIPTLSGDAGVYWEDGAGSSAHETAITRLAKEDLVTAEKMFSLASVLGGKSYPKTALNAAWKDAILYDEHTWGAGGSISEPESKMTRGQWDYKARFATNASKTATSLKEQAFDSLVELVKVNEPSVAVFNPLSWPVSDIVKMKTADGTPVEFIAEVPAMAFKVYPLNKVGAPAPAAPAGNTLENQYYQVEFDTVTGAVKSLFDKELNRELVDSSAPYGINQYIYITGLGDAVKENTRTAQTGPATLSKEIQLGRQIMHVQASGLNKASLTTEVVLYDNQKRIDFLNTLDKTLTYEKEAGYFAFPFGLTKPQFHVQLPNGVVSPNKDMLPGGCMAWYCAQDFVTASDDTVSVTWTALDSPLLTLCDIDHETGDAWPIPKAAQKWPSLLDKGHIYGYAFNNYWFTNYKAGQDGKLTFRFALTSTPKYDQAAASKFGQSVRNPLIARVVEPMGKQPAASSQQPASLCSVGQSNIVIQAVKKAESGEGLIIRLREVGGKKTKATLTFPAMFKEAWSCNLVEDPQKKMSVSSGKVSVTVPANGLATVLVK